MDTVPTHDAIVIGAGLVGSAIALRLAQEGLRVALLERNAPGQEASWAGAGMLSPAPDTPASIPLVPFSRASLSLYPQFIAEIEEICGRRTGYRSDGAIELLFSSDAERELSTLIALHHALGLPTRPLPIDEAIRIEPALTRRAQAAAYFPYEASVDNRALIEALLAAASLSGVELFPSTHVSANRDRAGTLYGGTDRRTGTIFAAQDIIVAAGTAPGFSKASFLPIGHAPARFADRWRPSSPRRNPFCT